MERTIYTVIPRHRTDSGLVRYLNVASRLDSGLQDLGWQMFGELSLRALALLLLQRLRDGGVELVGRLQLRPEVSQIVLVGKETNDRWGSGDDAEGHYQCDTLRVDLNTLAWCISIMN